MSAKETKWKIGKVNKTINGALNLIDKMYGQVYDDSSRYKSDSDITYLIKVASMKRALYATQQRVRTAIGNGKLEDPSETPAFQHSPTYEELVKTLHNLTSSIYLDRDDNVVDLENKILRYEMRSAKELPKRSSTFEKLVEGILDIIEYRIDPRNLNCESRNLKLYLDENSIIYKKPQIISLDDPNCLSNVFGLIVELSKEFTDSFVRDGYPLLRGFGTSLIKWDHDNILK